MAKASDWVILTIVMLLGVILIPIVVDQVQTSEREISTIEKTVTLYPLLTPTEDPTLDTIAGTGTKTTLTTTSGSQWVLTNSKELDLLNADIKDLLGKTLTINFKVALNVSTVVVQMFLNISIIKSDWSLRSYIGQTAYSENITGDTDYHTVSVTFDFPQYAIVDKTDKLKIEWFVNVVTPQANSKLTMDVSGCSIQNFGYDYVNVNEGWGFTGGMGARTLFLLLPFIFIVGVVVYFIGQMLGKW